MLPAAIPATEPLALEVRGVVRTFPGVRALDGASLQLRPGEVHALIGENGAGKSTLINLLAGIMQPDAGTILLEGAPVRIPTAHDAARRGIGVVFQELSLVPNLSIAENIYANRQPTGALNMIDRRRLHGDAEKMLGYFELSVPPARLVKHLSVAQRQVVEILKAMSHQPRVLILDEPTSSLTAPETRLLFANIRRLKSEGVSFIYISHHLSEIFEIADRVTVLRDGRTIDTREVAEVDEETLVRLMVGRELENMYGQRAGEIGEAYFRVEGASRGRAFRDVSFALRRGEILALAGLVGAGRTELARGLFGLEPLERGIVTLEGRELRIRHAAEAIAAGIGYLTEDRKEEGLFLRMGVRDNVVAPSLSRFAGTLGFMREGSISSFAAAARDKFRIATPTLHQKVRNLSGGNQQKVLLSAWMGTEPGMLIVDEPTRGVDVGARSEIYARLRELAAAGVGILLISSDLLEVLGLADRILVMREGRIAGEFTAADATEEDIIACAAGVEMTR